MKMMKMKMMKRSIVLVAVVVILSLLFVVSGANPIQADPVVRFAVIGDFGQDGPIEAAVANLVDAWNVDFVITVGDNNYPDGAASTIDRNIGKYYSDFIKPYVGDYGPGSPDVNRFFPALGNHDWRSLSCDSSSCSGPHFDYFELPNNERYYDVAWDPVHLFIIDSDDSEPDGRDSASIQANWLQAQLAASTAQWKLVFMHHAPYSSSSNHGSQEIMQWPYKQWGATAVFAGHDHVYERLIVGDLPYFVDGLGGNTGIYGFGLPLPGSQVRYNSRHGALLAEVTSSTATFQFINIDGIVIDTYTLSDTPTDEPVATFDSYTTPEDTPLSVEAPGVLANDSDPNGDPLTAVLDSNPGHGTLTLNEDGSFVYAPAAGFVGQDYFTYHAFDGVNASHETTVMVAVTDGCPIEVALDEPGQKDSLDLLRQLRDEVLAANPATRRYVERYYHHAPEVARMLLLDAQLRTRTAQTLQSLLPALQAPLGDAGQDVALSKGSLAAIDALLQDIGRRGGSELRATIAEVQGLLQQFQGRSAAEAWKLILAE